MVNFENFMVSKFLRYMKNTSYTRSDTTRSTKCADRKREVYIDRRTYA